MASKLTPRQAKFCEYYILGADLDGINTMGNATRSYIKAYGAKQETAETNGSRLLNNAAVCSEIARLLQEQAEIREAAIEDSVASDVKTLNELGNIAYSDITQTVAGTYNTVYEMASALREQPAEVKAAVQEIFVTESLNEQNGSYTVRLKIKLYDKLAALKVLANYFGLDTPFQNARAVLKQHGIAMKEDANEPTGWRLEVHEVKGAS